MNFADCNYLAGKSMRVKVLFMKKSTKTIISDGRRMNIDTKKASRKTKIMLTA